MNVLLKFATRLLLIPLGIFLCGQSAIADHTFTSNADFDEGTLVNLNHDSPYTDQLQLNVITSAFPFINVAASGRGTVVRINTETGEIIGEYRTAPEGYGLNPSRTTVDLFGNVWTGNRDESGPIDGIPHGSVVKIGLIVGGTRVDSDGSPNPVGEYLQPPFGYNTCDDRDDDGLIKTSLGMLDILSWPDGTDGAGGATALVEDADDECILIYQRVEGAAEVRHISLDADNNVWVGGYPGYAPGKFHKLDGNTGAVLLSFNAADVGCGGYGGLVDGNGVLWSASMNQSRLLRYDPAVASGVCIPVQWSYGLGVDTDGYIWNSQWIANQISKLSASGLVEGGFPMASGGTGSRGVAITPKDNNVWIANSRSHSVSRLDNNGFILKIIPVTNYPTGVAVDAAGKVWVTNRDSNNAMRIDPDAGGDGLGAVDLVVDLGPDAAPYDYSDMTGAVVTGVTSKQGFWRVVHNSDLPGMEWGSVLWNTEPEASEPVGSSITVEARAAASVAGLGNESFSPVINGGILGLTGQFIEVRAILKPDPSGISPVLSDLSVRRRDNEPPIATNLVIDPNPIIINGLTTITANINDTTTGNSNILSAYYTVDGGSPVAMTAADGAFDSPDEDVTASTSFATAGVHTICVHGYDVINSEPSNEVCALFAVYDPDAGFVTGGGWIKSPMGAYGSDPNLYGKAHFNFVSKYKKGKLIPGGNTQFRFHAAKMKFRSKAYDWLVIEGNRAQYMGKGTINGKGNYGFMLFGIDGDLKGGDGIDRFRIKIWDKDAGNAVIYDNEMGAADDAKATTKLGGGSIVIHSR
jgi:streptogramin lyase